jgi:hypothetical protein
MVSGFTCGGSWTVTYGATSSLACRRVTRHVVATRSVKCGGAPSDPILEIGRLEGDIVFEVTNMFDCVSSRPAGEVIAPSTQILGPDGQPLTRDRTTAVVAGRCGDCGPERGMGGVRELDGDGRVVGSRVAHRRRGSLVAPRGLCVGERGLCVGRRGLSGLRRAWA